MYKTMSANNYNIRQQAMHNPVENILKHVSWEGRACDISLFLDLNAIIYVQRI